MSRPIGVIAGVGRLPELIASAAKQQGNHVVVIRGVTGAFSAANPPCDHLCDVFFGEWNEVVQTLKRHDVAQVYMAGKISRDRLYQSGTFDERFRRIFSSIAERSDDAVTEAFVADLEREGIRVGAQADYLGHLASPVGVLTDGQPSREDWQDIARGYRVAKALGQLDVGQTAVIKKGAVAAAEAIEGTDEAIRRGSELVRGGTVVVKVAKPNQDPRFDGPTVGMDTLRAMDACDAGVLAVEAGQVFLVEREEMVAFAQSRGIVLVSYAPGMEEAYSQ